MRRTGQKAVGASDEVIEAILIRTHVEVTSEIEIAYSHIDCIKSCW